MYARNRTLLLLITAFVEAATGLCLLFLPAVLFAVLLGVDKAAVEALFVARLAGAALFAIAIASWIARTERPTPGQFGILTGILIYNVAATILLAIAGAVLKMVGVLLWPAVAVHAILAGWCLSCLRPNSIAKHSDGEGVRKSWRPF
jgi:hypothetical protein